MFYLDDEEKENDVTEEVKDTETTVEEKADEPVEEPKVEDKKEETVKVEATRVESSNNTSSSSTAKSKMAAGLLGIFLGCFGVHNFYLGYTGKAIAQLLLTLIGWIACGIGPAAAAIWGLVEGIMILTGSINTDADGNPLED